MMFSDGIRPGGDLTELDGSREAALPAPGGQRGGRKARKVDRGPAGGIEGRLFSL